MVSRFLLGALALLTFLIVANRVSNLSGQDSGTSIRPDTQAQLPERVSDQTYRINVDLVNIFCSVWDKKTNAFVTTLTRDDFTIFEDNRKQEVKNFARETNLPLTIAMLIDTSQSVAPKLKFEQEAATSFFHSILRENDRAMLVDFDSGVSLVQDFTSDPNKMANEIRALKAAGGTAMYDAIYQTCDEKLIREMGRKAIIIMSDGEDQSSRATMEEALNMALRAEATVFSISVNQGGFFGVGGGDSREGDRILKQLAESTGGSIFYPFKVDELDDAFRQINRELRSQYNIGYVSSNDRRDGSYRKVEITIPDKNLRLSYRKAYYAPAN